MPSVALTSLTLSEVELLPAFDSSTLAYTADCRVVLPVTTVTATPEDPAASISILGQPAPAGVSDVALSLGVTDLEIEVTAADGSRSQTYAVSVDRSQSIYTEARFGLDYRLNAMAVAGQTLVTGDSSGTLAGSAHVYEESGEDLVEQVSLAGSRDVDGEDSFGFSVAIGERWLVVGAVHDSSADAGIDPPGMDDDSTYSGAAYVFARDENWEEQAYLKSSINTNNSSFGFSVATEGELVVVGAPFDGMGTVQTGAVYVFERVDGTFVETARLTPDPPLDGQQFGFRLALDGGVLAVSAPVEDLDPSSDSNSNEGAVYLFERNSSEPGAAWPQIARLVPSPRVATQAFGRSVALSAGRLVVGAYHNSSASAEDPTDAAAPRSGAAYVFRREGADWVEEAFLKPDVIGQEDTFGSLVTLQNDVLLVSAPSEQSAATGVNGDALDNSLDGAGAAYLFTYFSGTWSQTAYLKPENSQLDSLQQDVALSDDAVFLVGGDQSSAVLVRRY
jgi:hypothetical protein